VPSNAWCFEPLWDLGEGLGRSSGWGIEQGRGLARRRPWRHGGAARPWHGRLAGTPAVPPLYSSCAPSWQRREERRGVSDRGQHAISSAGNAAWSGPTVLMAWPTGEGRRDTWHGGDFKAPRSVPGLGKARPREGAGGPDAEAVVRRARARPAHRPSQRRVPAANCFTVALFDHDFLLILK
jgi:hypothetical protein